MSENLLLTKAIQKMRKILGDVDMTPAERLDADIARLSREQPWKIATVKTDYGSVIDFTKLGVEEKAELLSDPTFAESVVHRTWSHHPGGVFLPAKSSRTNRSDAEMERLTIWKMNRKVAEAQAAA